MPDRPPPALDAEPSARLQLVRPSLPFLAGYVAALERGWSADSARADIEITTDPQNLASQRVIEANGGVLHERFVEPPQFGSTPGLRYRIALR